MPKDERETKDDGGQGDKRRDSVVAVEDEQADECKYDKHAGDENRVQLSHRRTNVLRRVLERRYQEGIKDVYLKTSCQRTTLAVYPTNGFAHFLLGNVAVSVLVEDGKCGLLENL